MTKITATLNHSELEPTSSITTESVLNMIKSAKTINSQRIGLSHKNNDSRSPIDELINKANPYKEGSIDHTAFHIAGYATVARIVSTLGYKCSAQDIKALSDVCAKLKELVDREELQNKRFSANIAFILDIFPHFNALEQARKEAKLLKTGLEL